MKKLIVILSTLMFTASLTGCYTVKGFGKDMEAGGEKVQETSDNVRK